MGRIGSSCLIPETARYPPYSGSESNPEAEDGQKDEAPPWIVKLTLPLTALAFRCVVFARVRNSPANMQGWFLRLFKRPFGLRGVQPLWI